MDKQQHDRLKESFIANSIAFYDDLLQPINSDNPCGEDISEQQVYLDLKTLCEPNISGFATQQEDITQWHSIFDKTRDLLLVSKNINVFMWHCRAALNAHGLIGFSKALIVTTSVIETYWDSIYPLLDKEENNDSYERVNALQGINEHNGICNDIRECTLFKSGNNEKLVLNSFLNTENHFNHSAATQAMSALIAASEKPHADEFLASIQIINSFIDDINNIFAKYDNNRVLAENFDFYTTLILKFIPDNSLKESSALNDTTKLKTMNSKESNINSELNNVIKNRDDVEKMLTQIIAYYEKEEPSSPLPFLLNRAKKLLRMNFIDIVNELNPQGLDEARSICGINE